MHKLKLLYIIMVFILLVSSFSMTPTAAQSSQGSSSTIYVDVEAGGSNNGTSWANAFTTLQPALAAALPTDQVWVAAGIYLPTAQYCGSGDRFKSFQLKNGVALYGGFDPSVGDVDWDDRDWEANVTILSGDIGITGNSSDNSYHVFCHPDGLNLDGSAILDGFTVTAGVANSNANPHYLGGGMYNDSSSPILANLIFSGNTATSYGGGLSNYEASPTLINVTFLNNTASSGGGMSNYAASSPMLTNVTFSGNTAEYNGGGMFNYIFSSPMLINAAFTGNTATNDGGGMYNEYTSSPTLANVTFSENTAQNDGGGMFNYGSYPTLTNVTFSNNSSNGNGGGISNWMSSLPTLANSILWGDTPDEIYNYNSSLPVVTYSDVQGGYSGVGNINADPLFVNSAGGNLRLQQYSPAIDAGDNAAPGLVGITTDLDGNPRFIDDPAVVDTGNGTPPIVDMGAYEVQPGSSQRTLYVDAEAGGSNNGTSWANAYTTLQPALAAALPTDQVWVAAGSYLPTAQYCGSGDRFKSFQLKNNVALYGGFDPSVGDVDWDDRDWEANVTILSGDIGITGNSSDNSYHVFCHSDGLNLDGSAILDGFTITAGNANSNTNAHYVGGGMYNVSSSPTLANLTFAGNIATGSGGGIANYYSQSTLTNVTLAGNSAGTYGGGIFTYQSPLTLMNVALSNNSASSGGGMDNLDSSPTLTNVNFSGNTAVNSGGGMYNDYHSSPTLADVTFTGNTATNYGGGMLNYNASSPMLTNVTFSNNSASMGGGMFNYQSSSPTLAGVNFVGNTAVNYGGGMENFNASSPTLTDVTFSNNTSHQGGGMSNYSSAPSLIRVTFTGNTAGYSGGGMANESSSPSLTNVAFTGNSSANWGGGMFNAQSSPILDSVTFSGNTTQNFGGGMYNFSTSSPYLINITFSNNSSNAFGGGMANDVSSSPTLANVTFNGNTAGYVGGGVYNTNSSSPTLVNSILWGDTPGEIYNEGTSITIVTFSDIQGGYSGEGNININPLLGLLADHGGYVLTHALGFGSPAIDAGNPDPATCPPVDARGEPRPYDGDGDGSAVCDMGAFEYPTAPTFTTLTGDFPDPSLPAQPFTVSVSVTSTLGIPTGIVTVAASGSQESCDASLAGGVGSCSLTLQDIGAYTLLAEYTGNEFYLPSSDTDSHTVELASTSTLITADSPDPSLPGQSFSVAFEVTSTSGIPTGQVTITVSGSDEQCSTTLEGGLGSCDLELNTPGTYILAAEYSGDDFHLPSTDTESHGVEPATTATLIIADNPDPSLPNQPFSIAFEVTSAYGTPSGEVTITVSGSAEQCTASLLDGMGSCSLALINPGNYTLIANYGGDLVYSPSTSPEESHFVNGSKQYLPIIIR